MSEKKLKHCYLHIGSGKTGTSSIQSSMFKHRSTLREKGYLYPSNEANHIFFASYFREDPTGIAYHKRHGRHTRAMIDQYIADHMARFENELSSFAGHTLVLSSEYIPPTSENGCMQMAAYLEKWCEKTTVVCYVRDPLSHAISAAQQKIKMGFNTLHGVQRYTHFFSPSETLPKFENAFERTNMCVRPFDKGQLRNQNVLDDFIEVIGLTGQISLPTASAQSNASLSFEMATVAEAITRFFPREIDGIWNPDRAKTINLMNIPGVKFGLSHAAIEDIKLRSGPDRDYLKAHYAIELPDPSSTLNIDPQSKWDTETVEALAKRVNKLALDAQHANAKALFYQGINAELVGNNVEAITHLKASVELNPKSWETVSKLCLLLHINQQYEEAGAVLNSFEKLRPQSKHPQKLRLELAFSPDD